jgi:putative selenate reductase
MAILTPYPFDALVRRMFHELRTKHAVFDLPRRRFYPGDPERDLSVRFHGHRAASPFGPAAGPHSQMAQNLVLAWLGGARIFELKTVQVNDELEIPRPCIDMQTVGYNVEWSQELSLEQSLAEYVKGAMLIHMLTHSDELELAPGFEDVLYDMSIGYDLASIESPRVARFIRGMMDASTVVDRLRGELAGDFRKLRDLDFPTRISRTLTLSTFHGCPPDEIERIIEHLYETYALDCIVKLNPMLLGPVRVRELLHDVLGYDDIRVPDSAFARDTTWEQALDFIPRLVDRARSLGRGFGIKLTNTLIVENHRSFFPATEKEMYLSGAPLHVLAIELARRFRREFGDTLPISFSAGIERANFADAVTLGFAPVTVCTDLLKPGGYGRAQSYFTELCRRMDACGASTIGDFIIRAHGHGERALAESADDGTVRARCRTALDKGGKLRTAAGSRLYERWASTAALLNTETVAERVRRDPRYTAARNAKLPRKIGSHLELFDCITCDKCIPVCPNDANFTFVLPHVEIPILRLEREGSTWHRRERGSIRIEEKHQIGNFADFCNDCGNCDVFCPEDGGPYVVKPRFFGSSEAFETLRTLDGFYLARRGDGAEIVRARFGGREFHLALRDGGAEFSGPGFAITFKVADPEGTIAGDAAAPVDLTYFFIMNHIRTAILAPGEVNYVSTLRAKRPESQV